MFIGGVLNLPEQSWIAALIFCVLFGASLLSSDFLHLRLTVKLHKSKISSLTHLYHCVLHQQVTAELLHRRYSRKLLLIVSPLILCFGLLLLLLCETVSSQAGGFCLYVALFPLKHLCFAFPFIWSM